MNNLINNIECYLDKSTDLKQAESILKLYSSNDWINYIPNNQIKPSNNLNYTRHLVTQHKLFDIFIIEWPKDSISGIHNHSSNGCLLKVLKGNLIENNYNKQLEFINSCEIKQGNINYIHNNLRYHSIQNNYQGTSYSLHIYSPAKHATQYFT